ncbi:uncharacterized protein FIBRA_06476 [Fibroporia radiculosa]|uniref:GATA-type domain-containing protein n=1 Tax=Fibroporia radiculosa TaxID=599839 RepID=J4GST6_9APHY|nr:uncharacterized protein FIBRA_06476 [Fibroporia radiculosa]CCM04305.1 predicted protein [Fibroporia radiculosa]
MSFVASPQRGYDSLAHSGLPPLPSMHPPGSRIPIHPLSSFDNVPAPSLPPLSSGPLAPASSHILHSSDRGPPSLPRLGQTRCCELLSARPHDRSSIVPDFVPSSTPHNTHSLPPDWSLLTPDLHFLYLDPVLANHLEDQADLLIGKSLLAFVHPEEQASAKLDLGSVLESRTLHGSVTRVRYSRLSRVRRQLGCQGPTSDWSDADKVSVDANYMAVDIVINWASDGLVLCFMHAVVDLTPRDNDEHNKTGWTNWCGTPYMSMDQVQLLYQRLLSAVPQPLSMSRVFQILLNQPDRSLLMSWPPEQHEPGSPTARDFAKLAQDVQITSASSGGTDAKTSCTRRYKAHQNMNFGVDSTKEVESIFIPHGSIIFACHKVNPSTRQLNPNDATQANGSGHYSSQTSHQYYDQHSHSYSLPPVPAPSSYHSGFPSHNSSHYSGSWSQNPESPDSPGRYSQWNVHNGALSSAPSVSSVRSSSYPAPPPPQQHQWPSQPPAYLDANPSAPPALSQSAPPSGSPYPAPGSSHDDTPPSPGSDYVPPSRVTHRRGSNTREQYGNGGRSTGNPPVGITRCSSCKVTHSPEWRKGPSGKKDLCNACGLRYARSRAKKDGGSSAQSRRRKDRVFNNMQKEHSPSGSPVPAPYSNIRRSSYYEDHSFASTSANGSGPAADLYPPHPAPTGYGGISPSPSPPSGGMHYAPYPHQPSSHHNQNPHGENRPHYAAHGGQFYSVPPPAPPPQAMHPTSGHSHLPGHRLDPIVPYSSSSRLSPGPSPTSPTAGSPLGGGLSASYERERPARDHD